MTLPALQDPWQFAADAGEGVVMAVIIATEGPAYRRRGAAMAIAADGRKAGGITSGCIEADLVLRAEALRAAAAEGGALSEDLRYGEGSPFADLRLACGGSLSLRLFLLRDQAALAQMLAAQKARQDFTLCLSPEGRLLPVAPEPEPAEAGQGAVLLRFRPKLRIQAFGEGAELLAFARMALAAGAEIHAFCAGSETKAALAGAGVAVSDYRGAFAGAGAAPVPVPDRATAVLLFFHNHEQEPVLLQQILKSEAFYIGAQGARRSQQQRLAALAAAGVPEADLARITGPVGASALAPGRMARSPEALAASALAEVLALYEAGE